MRKAVINSIERRGQRTLLTYRSGGEKNQLEIAGSPADFRRYVRDTINENMELAVFLALANWMRRNQTAADFTGIEGKTITLDLDADPTEGILVIE